MKEVDVFIDLENVLKLPDVAATLRLVPFYAKRLPIALEVHDFHISSCTGFACSVRGGRTVNGQDKVAVRAELSRHNWRMLWGTIDADSMLKSEVGHRLRTGHLETVLLITSDGHFAPLVMELRASGREVLVAGHEVSKKLRRAASQCFQLKKFIGDDREDYLHHEASREVFGVPLPIPENLRV